MTLSLLFWATIVAAIISFWWQSDKVKNFALAQVVRHCKNQNLQLLDQTMVLRSVWPARDSEGSLKMRRCYDFEFASTGQARYKGSIELLGHQLQHFELEAHILPSDEDFFV